MRLLLGFLFVVAPGCLFGWEATKTDISQRTSVETSEGLDHLEPVDRKMVETPYLIEYIRQPAVGYQNTHLTLSLDDKSGRYFLRTWSEWKSETQPHPTTETLPPATKAEFPVDMASNIYDMWVNALLETRYDRLAHDGLDGWTDLFSVYIKGRGWLHGAAWSPTKELPPKWMEDSAKVLIQFTQDQDEKACRANLIGLRDRLFGYLGTNGKN